MNRSFPTAHKQYGPDTVSGADLLRVQELIAKAMSRAPTETTEAAVKKKKPQKHIDTSELDQLDWAILDILGGNGETAPSILAETLESSSATIRRHLSKLRELNLIESKGRTNQVRYWLTEIGLNLPQQEGVDR